MQNKSKQNDIENAVMSAFEDPNPNTSMVRSRTMLGVSMPNNKVKSQPYDNLDDIDDEPLVKIPRFSFQTPNGIHSPSQNQQHIMIGIDGVENKLNFGGNKITLKGGMKRPFQQNDIIDDELDI